MRPPRLMALTALHSLTLRMRRRRIAFQSAGESSLLSVAYAAASSCLNAGGSTTAGAELDTTAASAERSAARATTRPFASRFGADALLPMLSGNELEWMIAGTCRRLALAHAAPPPAAVAMAAALDGSPLSTRWRAGGCSPPPPAHALSFSADEDRLTASDTQRLRHVFASTLPPPSCERSEASRWRRF